MILVCAQVAAREHGLLWPGWLVSRICEPRTGGQRLARGCCQTLLADLHYNFP
jgi:hypothetical protein